VHTYCDSGDSNHTLLLLHGFSFRQGLYPLFKALEPDFRVVVPDLPFSTRNDFKPGHSLQNYADYLLAFIEALELENVSVFGNSVGGTLGLMICLKDPEKFEKLIVRCPVWSGTQLPYYIRVKPLIWLHEALSSNDVYALKILSAFYSISAKMFPRGDQATSPAILKQPGVNLPCTWDQCDPIVLSKFLGHLIKVEIERQLSLIQNKTLILWGQSDKFIRSTRGVRLNELLPDSQYLEMQGEYHNIATSDPVVLTKVLLEFVLD